VRLAHGIFLRLDSEYRRNAGEEEEKDNKSTCFLRPTEDVKSFFRSA